MKPTEPRPDVPAPVDRGKGKGLTDLDITQPAPPESPLDEEHDEANHRSRDQRHGLEERNVTRPAPLDVERKDAERK